LTIRIDESGPVVRINFGRPEEGNAMTVEMMRELSAAVREHGARPKTHVIALVPEGSHFCRGRDTHGGPSSGEKPSALVLRKTAIAAVLDVHEALARCPIPTIACVQGNAIGFGAAMAASADITLIADDAAMSFPEIEHNIPPALGMAATLCVVPPKALAWLVYSAEQISAERAVACGLASKALPRASFRSDADAFVAKLAGRPRLTLETIKLYQSKATGLPLETQSEYAGTLMALISTAS
jgi:methylglutaconyl-CoA hydratase